MKALQRDSNLTRQLKQARLELGYASNKGGPLVVEAILGRVSRGVSSRVIDQINSRKGAGK